MKSFVTILIATSGRALSATRSALHVGYLLFIVSCLCLAGSAYARINVVTLPGRDSVQLTIYNSVDLTLVKETRQLTFRKGLNRLEFSWANTLIDPTSVELRAVSHADEVDVLVVGSRGDEDCVTVACGVDSGLNGWLIARNMDGARASRDCTDQEENEAEKLKNRRTRRTDSHGNVWSKIASSVRAEAF